MKYFKIKKIILILFFSVIICRDIDYLNFQINAFDNPYPGNIFIHTMGSPPRYMAVIDSSLNPSWFVNCGPRGLDFKPSQNKLSYFHKIEQKWILLNDYMIETDTLACVNGYGADYHDIQLLEDGTYFLQAYDSITVDMSEIVSGGNNNTKIIILVLQEFSSDHNLIFEWNAWEHLNIADYTNLDLTAERIEWMHGNSIHIDSDSNIIISNRRSSEIIKINRNNGDIIWYFGGPNNEFNISNDSLNGFSKQHDVRRIENGNILLFDNGNEHYPPISRVVEYEIDETEKTANLVWEFFHPQEHLGLAMGSVQRLPNNNTLINWGTMLHQGAIITEVDYDKNIVLEIEFPTDIKCYKVRKHNWQFATNLISGDTNLDDEVNILDLNYIADYDTSTSSDLDMFHLFRFDINRDGIVDENDINILAEQIMQ